MAQHDNDNDDENDNQPTPKPVAPPQRGERFRLAELARKAETMAQVRERHRQAKRPEHGAIAATMLRIMALVIEGAPTNLYVITIRRSVLKELVRDGYDHIQCTIALDEICERSKKTQERRRALRRWRRECARRKRSGTV